ncbi:S-adenosylmethionine:tRNA ribosyltransferase-isomerase [Candidatus Entotheonellaceae bacterium PAL068K]
MGRAKGKVQTEKVLKTKALPSPGALAQSVIRNPYSATMRLKDFDFTLPPALIAQTPAVRRDHSRLMIVQRAEQRIGHDVFHHIGNYLSSNDVLVVNDTKVIPARLRGRKRLTGGKVEVLLLHEHAGGLWDVLLRPAAKVPPGTVMVFGDGLLCGEVVRRYPEGPVVVRFTPPDIHATLATCGEVPLPPYIQRGAGSGPTCLDKQRYQTVYARYPGSVAAPTAGLHFTPELLGTLQHQGIHRASVTLHVGWGTFQPLRTDDIAAYRMDQERYCLTPANARIIRQARAAGGRVVAVGTTVTRALETIVQEAGRLTARRGWSELFIIPGYRFGAVETLITNFHLPRSTLFLLVCAFAGRELMHEAYRVAVAERYRFYSYGDAMLIQ